MFVFIKATSLPWIEMVESGGTTDGNRHVAARELRADYGRIDRWLLGLAATAGGLLSLLPLGFGVEVAFDQSDPLAERWGFAVQLIGTGLLMGALAAWLLITLHRTGRRLTKSLAFWIDPMPRDARRARYLGYEPDILLRLTTSALSLLACVFAVSMMFYSFFVAPQLALTVTATAASALFAAVAIGQFGGIQRIASAYAR